MNTNAIEIMRDIKELRDRWNETSTENRLNDSQALLQASLEVLAALDAERLVAANKTMEPAFMWCKASDDPEEWGVYDVDCECEDCVPLYEHPPQPQVKLPDGWKVVKNSAGYIIRKDLGDGLHKSTGIFPDEDDFVYEFVFALLSGNQEGT